MSSTTSRYTKLYFNQLRSDVANYFPKNVFLRNPMKKKSKFEVNIQTS